jgi:hypothetical protein
MLINEIVESLDIDLTEVKETMIELYQNILDQIESTESTENEINISIDFLKVGYLE